MTGICRNTSEHDVDVYAPPFQDLYIPAVASEKCAADAPSLISGDSDWKYLVDQFRLGGRGAPNGSAAVDHLMKAVDPGYFVEHSEGKTYVVGRILGQRCEEVVEREAFETVKDRSLCVPR